MSATRSQIQDADEAMASDVEVFYYLFDLLHLNGWDVTGVGLRHRKTVLRNGDVHWVAPELVGEIGFTQWTDEGRLRHPRFLGLRNDKAPEEVVRERPG